MIGRLFLAGAGAMLIWAASAQAQNTRPSLLTTKPPEQRAIEREALNVRPTAPMKSRTTVVERVTGQRIQVTTNEAGTKVTEQGSGRTIWSSARDAHDLKIGEYTAGGMGQVVTPPGQRKRDE